MTPTITRPIETEVWRSVLRYEGFTEAETERLLWTKWRLKRACPACAYGAAWFGHHGCGEG